jgi:beta-glucosidase
MRWCVGIEDTAIGVPIRHSGRTLDEYELTEHDRRYREDLDLAASLGIDAIRYGVPWYRVNPAPGVYRWDVAEPMLEHAAQRLGLTVVVDLVHYGVPGWLADGFADPGYPEAVADYAGAFATRFADLVRCYTPLNEPGVTAAFCGEVGGWPPYLEGSKGWTTVTLAVADGIQRSIRAIRTAMTDPVIVHVEAAKVIRPCAPSLLGAARIAEHRAWLATDLVVGRVNEHHPLMPWLLANGAEARTLEALLRAAEDVEVMGVNFYPQYSVREMIGVEGGIAEIAGGGDAADLVAVLQAWSERYGRPVAVTETSYDGTDAERVAWLEASTAAVRQAQATGLDVWAYTWWPLFDFVDWGIAAGGVPFEDFLVRVERADGSTELRPLPSPGLGSDPDEGAGPWLRRMGLWRLEPGKDGLERVDTPVASVYRALAADDRWAVRGDGDR